MRCSPLLAHEGLGLMTGLIPHMYAASEKEPCFFANHKYAVCTLGPPRLRREDRMWLGFNTLRLSG